MKLYYHPRSTYCHKVLIALYEKQVAFTPIQIYPGDPKDRATLQELTPLGKVPLLVLDSGWKIPESTTIVEYLDTHAPGPRMIPADPDLARQTRFHDRIADLYVTESYRTIVQEPEATERVAAARARLDALFAGINKHLENRTWIMGDDFTLADSALTVPLATYGSAHGFGQFKHLSAYLERALQRPSVARVRREHQASVAKAAS